MGNIWSLDLEIELYKWSSAEYPQEYALVYTSVNDKSKFGIFRMSVRAEKVLLRFADCFCDDHPIRVNMELIAGRDNKYGHFKYRLVRVVEAGTTYFPPSFHGGIVRFSTVFCQKRGFMYSVTPPGVNKMTWNVIHSYSQGIKMDVNFHVNVECHKMDGLSVNFKGPFKFKFPGLVTESLLEQSTPQIQREVHGEPPKPMKAFVESAFTGKEYILFRGEGRGCGGTEASVQGSKVTVKNRGGHFQGSGSGSKYENCHVVMNYKAPKPNN